MTGAETRKMWRAVIARYEGVDGPHAGFNVWLLRTLRVEWQRCVRPDTSMFTMFFTRPGTTADRSEERVKVEWESDERVAVSLERMTAPRAESWKAGFIVVAADFVRPENAVPVVESFLLQISGPRTLSQRIGLTCRRRRLRPHRAPRSRTRGDQA